MTLLLLPASCDEAVGCTAVACGSSPAVVRLLDDAGMTVTARGERRISRGANTGVAVPFDCRAGADAGPAAPCANGALGLNEVNLAPGLVYELRFARADGSFSAWQVVPLELEERTDPDFNGPGCSCSWYEAKPASVIVPAEARLPE